MGSLLARPWPQYFETQKGVIMLDFLPQRLTITGVHYANLLDQLRSAYVETAEVNSLKVFCYNKTRRVSKIA